MLSGREQFAMLCGVRSGSDQDFRSANKDRQHPLPVTYALQLEIHTNSEAVIDQIKRWNLDVVDAIDARHRRGGI